MKGEPGSEIAWAEEACQSITKPQLRKSSDVSAQAWHLLMSAEALCLRGLYFLEFLRVGGKRDSLHSRGPPDVCLCFVWRSGWDTSGIRP